MKLYIRTQEPGDRRDHVQFDHCFEVDSQDEWRARIEAVGDKIITSVLKPSGFRIPLVGPHLHKRSHPHERHYTHDLAIHESYRAAAEKLARAVETAIAGSRRCLVYLPLRGALPIWRAVKRYLREIPAGRLVEYHAVTSSFVMYPDALEIRGKGCGRASGRYANILELRRLRDWCIGPMGFDHLLYVDEIVSGGMLRGHVNEMIELGVTAMLPVTVAALADAFGTRSKANGHLNRLAAQRTIHAFVWEGCHTLVSEDQKFTLGTHYVDHEFGPHVVPVLTDTLEWFDEKVRFDRDVVGAVEAFDPVE
ncbi:hypothetical protein [Nannocystis sp. SCPEA4]|uniref:hypothetical protein n=1 Tax=Nannocystis sp. SCPEA4 TaxID=2996787 RepID=UPI00226EE667|nr:hypothetical protein [Nannocystis sp. SCPEA4]MCY1060174.1 hypothetical protein [Nannocystis sp. SCPEA4]